jgi:Trk K+ transport system NAD-binding subunit
VKIIIVGAGEVGYQKFLEQENIGHMDMVAAVTWDEEMNILSCLLAKRLGAKKTEILPWELIKRRVIEPMVWPRR